MKISIVVPVYNVERYLEKCLTSIVNQTFLDYEVILVNDGSIDNSLSICKKYESNYNNVKVISQDNAGLSCARNAGIKIATGEYITFVDSDDWISSDFCEVMYKNIKLFDADIVLCRRSYYDEFTNEDVSQSLSIDIDLKYRNKLLSPIEMLELFACGKFELMSAYSKLFKTSIFSKSECLFPEGFMYEDGVPNLNAIINNNKFVLLDERMYFYRHRRTGSICFTDYFKKKNILERYTQYILQIKLYNSTNVANEYKKKHWSFLSRGLAMSYLEYQIDALKSLLVTDKLEALDVVFFGASIIGASYAEFLGGFVRSVCFADNDFTKQGTTLCGYSIVSPSEALSRPDHRLIITTFYFFEVLFDLFDNKQLESFSDILPYNGATALERVYVDCFKKLHDVYKNNSCIA